MSDIYPKNGNRIYRMLKILNAGSHTIVWTTENAARTGRNG